MEASRCIAFDYLVGARKDALWYHEAEQFCHLEVDDQLVSLIYSTGFVSGAHIAKSAEENVLSVTHDAPE
jgi:hypothetical protein